MASPNTFHQRISRKISLNEENFYGEPTVYYKDDIAKSSIFSNLNVSLKEIFKNS
ncbi:MAG: hypothetical protein ABF633_07130 [Clostridium sp.]|uniref:hypothetical protein n=1 Tax=Clostridium sp. TaxID=1506 RepID=UPI0039E8E083